MKIIFFSCSHYKQTPPINRKDGYGEQILAKINQIQDRAEEENAPIICLGDLTDRKYNITIREAYKLFETIRNDIDWYLLLGNHDIQAYNQDIETQVAGLLEEAGKVQFLGKDDVLVFDGVYITGEPYRAGYEVAETYAREVTKSRCRWHIHCTHGMITEKSVPWESWTVGQIEEILECDLLMNGHNHKPFEFDRVCNTGSIARIAKKENNLNRVPSYMIFDTETKDCERVELEYENDVWIEREERDTMTNEQLYEFIKEVQEMDVDRTEIIDVLLKDVAEEVREVFYKYLEE